MIEEYIKAAMNTAHYEIIEDEEPYYGEIPELKGVWASGKTLEGCRDNLHDNLKGWILIRTSQGMEIPEINGCKVITPKVLEVA
ncbi:MAG: type II toxin-antitoxin system HicB family antitoxin [Methylococcales bacterium]|nr:type II toxin-antitoxin system HicB family antitoxin [Methylococcales bacterium]